MFFCRNHLNYQTDQTPEMQLSHHQDRHLLHPLPKKERSPHTPKTDLISSLKSLVTGQHVERLDSNETISLFRVRMGKGRSPSLFYLSSFKSRPSKVV